MGKFALSKIVFLSVFFFILGLALSPYLGVFYLLFLILLFALKDKRLTLLLIFSFLSGFFYYKVFSAQDFTLPLYQDQEITLQGRVVEEDRNVVLVKNYKQKEINEKAILYTDGNLQYGQLVRFKGEPVSVKGEYQDYYRKDKISAVFFDPQLEVIGEDYNFKSLIFSLRRKFQQKIEKGLPYPQSSILKALIVGDRVGVPKSLSEKFSKVGVAHLLAISGTHIIIIAGILISLATLLSIKYKSTFTLLILSIFIILVGAPASAIRAGLMGSIFIFATKTNRSVNSLRSLIFVAFLMLLLNPFLLKAISFQLSFLATAGIILFSSKLKHFLTSKTSLLKEFPLLTDTLSITLSAQVFILPLIYIYFDHIPFLAPVSNLFLAPLLPLIMILTLFALFLSFLIPPFISFYPLYLLITFLLLVVDSFYKLLLLC